MVEKGVFVRDFEIREASKKTEAYYTLEISKEQAKAIIDRTDREFRLRSLTQIDVVKEFLRNEATELDEKPLMEGRGASYSQLKAMCDKGILRRARRVIDRSFDPLEGQPPGRA